MLQQTRSQRRSSEPNAGRDTGQALNERTDEYVNTASRKDAEIVQPGSYPDVDRYASVLARVR